jgi:hypothetical protein
MLMSHEDRDWVNSLEARIALLEEALRIAALESGPEEGKSELTCSVCGMPRRLHGTDADPGEDTRVERMIQALIVRGVTVEEYARAWREPHEVPCAVRRYTAEANPPVKRLVWRYSIDPRDGRERRDIVTQEFARNETKNLGFSYTGSVVRQGLPEDATISQYWAPGPLPEKQS